MKRLFLNVYYFAIPVHSAASQTPGSGTQRKSLTVVGQSISEQGQQRVRPLLVLQILAHSCPRSLLNNVVSDNSISLCCVVPWSSKTWRYFLFYLNKSFLSIRSSSYTVTHITEHCLNRNLKISSPSRTPSLFRDTFPFTPLLNTCFHVLVE